MARPKVTKETDANLNVRYTDRRWRPKYGKTNPIGAALDGRYVAAVLVATNVDMNEAQMDSLESQITAIAGVSHSFVIIGSSEIPVSDTPADHDLTIHTGLWYDIKPTPPPDP